MGNSAQQWRVSVGNFASRLSSRRWTQFSGERKRTSRSMRDEEDGRREARRKIVTEVLTLIYTVSLSLSAMLDVLVKISLLVTVVVSILSLKEMLNPANLSSAAGVQAWSRGGTTTTNIGGKTGASDLLPAPLAARLAQILLLACGDIEANPGPDPILQDPLVIGIAKLILEAPTENIKSTLGKWSPDKDVAAELNTILVPVLKETLAWLWNTDVNNDSVKKKLKPELISCVLVGIEALLPDNCSVCQEEYCVNRGETPALRCKGCHQGFHQPCLELRFKLTEEKRVPMFPGGLYWLCASCDGNYELLTSVGAGGAEKPRRSRRTAPRQPETVTQSQGTGLGGAAAAAPAPLAPPPAPQGGMENDVRVQEDSENIQVENVQAGNVQVENVQVGNVQVGNVQVENVQAGNVQAENDQVENVQSETDCDLFLRGECPHGISGKREGNCEKKHRKRCPKYMNWGNRVEKGCKEGSNCQFLHPVLCEKSLDLKCLDPNCASKQHTRKCERSRTPGGHGQRDIRVDRGERGPGRGDRGSGRGDRGPGRGDRGPGHGVPPRGDRGPARRGGVPAHGDRGARGAPRGNRGDDQDAGRRRNGNTGGQTPWSRPPPCVQSQDQQVFQGTTVQQMLEAHMQMVQMQLARQQQETRQFQERMLLLIKPISEGNHNPGMVMAGHREQMGGETMRAWGPASF